MNLTHTRRMRIGQAIAPPRMDYCLGKNTLCILIRYSKPGRAGIILDIACITIHGGVGITDLSPQFWVCMGEQIIYFLYFCAFQIVNVTATECRILCNGKAPQPWMALLGIPDVRKARRFLGREDRIQKKCMFPFFAPIFALCNVPTSIAHTI